MIRDDVIAAIASPVGVCAKIVLRVSGAGSGAVVANLLSPAGPLPTRGVVRARICVDGLTFPATLLLFEHGKSYTGEESAELHVPGNPLLARLTLEQLFAAGAKPAEPGEFTARAFFNGRLDLTEAEGVAATISATSGRELDAARRLGAGELTRRLRPIIDTLTQTLALVEAGIDFSEEEIRFITPEQVRQNASATQEQLRRLLSASASFERLAHEPLIVLCGRANAGKSSLLNALARRQRAVVSPVAGTTRDLLSAEVKLARGMVRLIDTAGLETETAAQGPIARQMREMAMQGIEQADLVILIHDGGDADLPVALPRPPDLVVMTKCDIHKSVGAVAVSAVTGEGMDDLRQLLDQLAFGSAGDATLALNARHVRQIGQALSDLEELTSGDLRQEELMAEHLRAASDALGEITGLVSTDDLLDRIFSSFCIGK